MDQTNRAVSVPPMVRASRLIHANIPFLLEVGKLIWDCLDLNTRVTDYSFLNSSSWEEMKGKEILERKF